MQAGVAFMLNLAIGSIVIFVFLLICVRVSVYMEETCPIRYCLKRKQRKMRKKFIQRMLYPDEPDLPDSPRPAPPSDENITADIICQPYIYRDAYSTGLTGLSMLANLPLTLGVTRDGNPGDALVTNSGNVRVLTSGRICFPQAVTPQVSHTEITLEQAEVETNHDGDDESQPPDYLNVAKDDSRLDVGHELAYMQESPPPSYRDCVSPGTSQV
ncbi:unnamed protein product [Orchesella dallaii]|uniref:Uncharacterized protein n=1 Tax=Orchesella dallaii TaxID=48710 RepID=A0ABP1RXV0_9HEXA